MGASLLHLEELRERARTKVAQALTPRAASPFCSGLARSRPGILPRSRYKEEYPRYVRLPITLPQS